MNNFFFNFKNFKKQNKTHVLQPQLQCASCESTEPVDDIVLV